MALRGDLEDGHDALRIGIGQGTQKHAVDDAENGGGRANGQRQRKHHDHGDAEVLPELPKAVLEVLPK